ncbi:MAG: undecaprenyldiphospho-muramoylpentapeptide beta-N-acetylglucosaminyltransferase [Bacteroidales bacterium]|nr:undecaprenyldiphospho-muramoylpentapeptide beta-N-acetylglucosaminyltransferase [Bacteroidales bacterium]
MEQKHKKIIISAGGTGGHIFPAISVANQLKEIDPNIKILFVGAKGKMEMEKVPAAGYDIVGLPVAGFQRRITYKNLSFFFKLLKSLRLAKKVVKQFKPDAVAGFGGFASGPTLRIAAKRKIPTIIQEQNSYAGVTNKLLAKRARKICVAYPGMERFFPAEKIIMTGNPVRQDIHDVEGKREQGLLYFELQGNMKIALVVGGSLGALTINESIAKNIDLIIDNKIQLIWQTGKAYFETAKALVNEKNTKLIKVVDFIARMDFAYAVSDVVISRAGASTVSELSIVKKPSILVPSPNVAEDHQTKNAMALIVKDAAMMVEDKTARESLVPSLIELIKDQFRMNVYIENVSKMAIKDSASIIANEILKLTEEKNNND